MTKNIPQSYSVILILVASGWAFQGCSKPKSETEEETTVTTTLTANLEKVNADFAPDSLDYGSAAQSSYSLKSFFAQTESSNPCEGYNIFSCQPVLLRLYIELSRTFLELSTMIVEGLGSELGELEDGATGVINLEDGDTVDYNKTDDETFSLLLKTSAGVSSAFVDVASNDVRIQMDLDSLQDEGAAGKMDVQLSFTDDDTWSIVSHITGMPCDDDDVRAPRNIWVRMTKADDLWKGKAIIYNPVWAKFDSTPTCATAEADNISMNFYTDFVGDNSAAKANVYTMQRDVTSFDSVSSYGMDTLATRLGIGGTYTTSSFVNPFCNADSTDTAEWGNTCASYSTAVSEAEFGPITEWDTPNEFYQNDITLPTELE